VNTLSIAGVTNKCSICEGCLRLCSLSEVAMEEKEVAMEEKEVAMDPSGLVI
jgi:hypothetical protein